MKTSNPNNSFVEMVINVMLGFIVLGAGYVMFMTSSQAEKITLFVISALAAVGLLFRLR